MVLIEEFAVIYAQSNSTDLMLFIKNNNLYIFDGRRITKFYPCSTSRVGFGFEHNSIKTPTGLFRIAQKIGDNQTLGMEFIQRKPVKVTHINRTEAELEHKILTRIIWISGLDENNKNTLGRKIYIHGTANEWAIGKKNTDGCIALRNHDIVELFDLVREGTLIYIFEE